jgi:hypothetical protein
MSLLIDSTDDLLTVIKKLNLKVASVDELRQLLVTINANYNPEAARQKTGKLIGVSVPTCMAIAAGVTSFFLLAPGQEITPFHVGIFALVWGACALVSAAAVIASAIMSSIRRGQASSENAPNHRNMVGERMVTGITNELP